jgi:hypothetical protein
MYEGSDSFKLMFPSVIKFESLWLERNVNFSQFLQVYRFLYFIHSTEPHRGKYSRKCKGSFYQILIFCC